MSQGLAVNNDSGQLLISSDTTSLYYYGAAQPESITGHLGYGGATFIVYNTYTSKQILPFIVPCEIYNYAVNRTYKGGDGYWRVEVMVGSPYAQVPELVIFTSADAENWSSRFTSGDGAYGLKVFRDDGTTAFDSGAGQPLVIKSLVNVTPPTDPTDGGTNLYPTHDYIYSLPSAITTPMFANFSMGMSERQYSTERSDHHCLGFDFFGCWGWSEYTYYYDLYWALYHTGISVVGTTVSAGWMTYTYNHYSYSSSSSGISIIIPIIPTGGGSSESGMPPFTTSSVNIGSSPVIFADRSFYPAFPISYTYPSPPAPTGLSAVQDGSTITLTMTLTQSFPYTWGHEIYTRPSGTSAWTYQGAFIIGNGSFSGSYSLNVDPAYSSYEVMVYAKNRYFTGTNYATTTSYV